MNANSFATKRKRGGNAAAMKRLILILSGAAAALIVAAAAILWFSPSVQDAVFARMVRAHLGTGHADLGREDAMRVVLCGTGSPLPDPQRASACTAVIAGDHMILIDAGAGSTLRLSETRLPLAKMDAVFLTHLHSDHLGDLGNTALQGWLDGRKTALEIFGPVGTANVVSGYSAVFQADAGYRIAHHGAANLPPDGSKLMAHEIATPGPHEAVKVYDRDGMTVEAFLVDHHPVAPAFGYRVSYKGRVVVLSGDTRPNANVEHFAQGADLLIHEALNKSMVAMLSDGLNENGIHRLGQMMHDTISYHTSPVDAAKIARKANVRMLVFSHVVPPMPNALTRHIFMRGVAAAAGPVRTMLGHDGQLLTLPVGSKEIETRDLL